MMRCTTLPLKSGPRRPSLPIAAIRYIKSRALHISFLAISDDPNAQDRPIQINQFVVSSRSVRHFSAGKIRRPPIDRAPPLSSQCHSARHAISSDLIANAATRAKRDRLKRYRLVRPTAGKGVWRSARLRVCLANENDARKWSCAPARTCSTDYETETSAPVVGILLIC